MTHLVVFLGPPGAGKGTQAIKIASDFNLAHISTGDMLRQHVKEQTDLGKIAKSLLDEGKLVPDDLVIQMLIERLGDDDWSKRGKRKTNVDGDNQYTHEKSTTDYNAVDGKKNN